MDAPYVGFDLSGVPEGVVPFCYQGIRKGATEDHLLLPDSRKIVVIFTDRCQIDGQIIVIPNKGKVAKRLAEFCLRKVAEAQIHHSFELEAELPAVLSPHAEELTERFLMARGVCDCDMVPVRVSVALNPGGEPELTYEGPSGRVRRQTVIDYLREYLILVERREESVDHLIYCLELASGEVFECLRAMAEKRGIRFTRVDLIWAWDPEHEGFSLVSEVGTPDYSCFCPEESYRPGQPQLPYLCLWEWLESVGWQRGLPLPKIPDEVIAHASEMLETMAQRIISN